MRPIINDQLADEIQLDRPPAGVAEWIFRVCLALFVVLAIVGGAARAIFSEDRDAKNSGVVGVVFGIVFLVCFLYVINYMAWRFCPTRWIRWTWFALEGFVVFALVMARLTG